MKRICRPSSPLALMAIALCAGNARADDTDPPLFSFGGFGTLSVTHATEKLADFTATSFKPSGAGYTRSWSADVDSLIAGQVTATFSRQFSAVVQVVAEQNYANSYRPHVEWANLKYQVTPEFSARIGRTALPVFLVADSRRVNYANVWVRPPIEVYNLVPVTSNDGIDASYRLQAGAATHTLHVTAGRSDSKFPGIGGSGSTTAQARDLVTLVDTFEHGPATLRLACSRVRITIPELDALTDAFRLFGAEGMAIADKYELKNTLARFCAVGANYDPGDWFVMGEWAALRAPPSLGDKSAWYVSGGYRFGKFTPYLTYARAKAEGLSDPGLTVASLPPFLAGPATVLNASLNAYLATRVVQNSASVGARWDFARKAALTLQYDRIRIGAGSNGPLRNLQPGFQPGGKVDVFSASIDFVF